MQYTRERERRKEREKECVSGRERGERGRVICIIILTILPYRWLRERGKNTPKENTRRKRNITHLIAHPHQLVAEDTPPLPRPLLLLAGDTPLPSPHPLTPNTSTSLERETQCQPARSKDRLLPINREGNDFLHVGIS